MTTESGGISAFGDQRIQEGKSACLDLSKPAQGPFVSCVNVHCMVFTTGETFNYQKDKTVFW